MNLRFTIQIYYGIYLPASVPLLVCTLFVVIICLLLATCTKHSWVQGDTRSAVYARHMVRSLQLLTLCLLRNREECSVPPWQQVEKKKQGSLGMRTTRAAHRVSWYCCHPEPEAGLDLDPESIRVRASSPKSLTSKSSRRPSWQKKKESFETPRTRAIINHLTYNTGCTRNACASVRDKFGTN